MITSRWLHADDPQRKGDTRGPPDPRTPAKVNAQAEETRRSTYVWNSKVHPRLKSGVNTWCPLNKLMMFNVIWDFTPDMMHVIGTFFERLVLGVFKGKREATDTIVKPAKLSNPSSLAKEKQHKRHAGVQAEESRV